MEPVDLSEAAAEVADLLRATTPESISIETGFAPALSIEQAQRLKKGEVLNIRAPGGGVIW